MPPSVFGGRAAVVTKACGTSEKEFAALEAGGDAAVLAGPEQRSRSPGCGSPAPPTPGLPSSHPLLGKSGSWSLLIMQLTSLSLASRPLAVPCPLSLASLGPALQQPQRWVPRRWL